MATFTTKDSDSAGEARTSPDIGPRRGVAGGEPLAMLNHPVARRSQGRWGSSQVSGNTPAPLLFDKGVMKSHWVGVGPRQAIWTDSPSVPVLAAAVTVAFVGVVGFPARLRQKAESSSPIPPLGPNTVAALTAGVMVTVVAKAIVVRYGRRHSHYRIALDSERVDIAVLTAELDAMRVQHELLEDDSCGIRCQAHDAPTVIAVRDRLA